MNLQALWVSQTAQLNSGLLSCSLIATHLVEVRIDGFIVHGATGKHINWRQKDTNLIICYDSRYVKIVIYTFQNYQKRNITVLALVQFEMLSLFFQKFL